MTLHGLLLLILVLAALGVALAAVLVGLLAWVILHPPRMTDAKAVYRLRRLSPGDLGLAYEPDRFTVRDGRSGRPLTIAAWWVPAAGASDWTAVLIHGYADAKVGGIAWAPVLHGLGLNVLAVDLRGHGESGGTLCTGGSAEAEDVGQVIDQLLAARPDQTRKLVLFGASLGAAVAAAVASGRTDVAAVVLESPYADYGRAVAAHARLVGLPDGPLLRAAVAVAQAACGRRFDAARPADTIPRITCPTLAIVGDADLLLDAADIAAIQSAVARQAAGPFASQTWVVPGAGHLTALLVDPAGYRRHVAAVLTAAGVARPAGTLPAAR